MKTRYEYRITVRNVDGGQAQHYHYNKTVAANEKAAYKRDAEVSAVTLERREMGSDTFELVSTWQREKEVQFDRT